MKGIGMLAIVVGIGCLSASAEAADNKVMLVPMTSQELAAQGVAIAGTRAIRLPYSCAAAGNPSITVSDRFLAHFRAKGFTSEAICLALSSRVRFDPETGRQLPVVQVSDVRAGGREPEIVLNFPPCFRNGVPFLECNMRFDSWWGGRLQLSQQTDYRRFAIELDTMVRAFLARTRGSGIFKTEALGRGLFSSEYEWFLASRALARGYGYALHGPEGDDPEIETVSLRTHRERGGMSAWNDE